MNVCEEVLDKVAPFKNIYIRANSCPFMNKDTAKRI